MKHCATPKTRRHNDERPPFRVAFRKNVRRNSSHTCRFALTLPCEVSTPTEVGKTYLVEFRILGTTKWTQAIRTMHTSLYKQCACSDYQVIGVLVQVSCTGL